MFGPWKVGAVVVWKDELWRVVWVNDFNADLIKL